MSRSWARLVRCVTLAAFLANIAGVAHAFQAPCRGSVPAVAATAMLSSEATSCCKHCRQKQAFTQQVVQTQNVELPADSCPCREHDPSQPCCPNGCIFCSVAKVPCHLTVALLPDSPALVIDRLVEAPVAYVSFPCDGLFRPPRA